MEGSSAGIEVFRVKKGTWAWFVVILDPEVPNVVIFKNPWSYWKFLRTLPTARRLTRWDRSFTVPEFLKFASGHGVLKKIPDWTPFELLQ